MKNINNIDILRISSENAMYEIFKSTILGTGSYSIVYLGRCIITKKNVIEREDKLVAIKKINIKNLSENSGRMITTEINIMQELIKTHHPNIVKCYDIINTMDVIYIIMEYCEGGDLSSLLIGKKFKHTYLKYYFKQILNGIEFLKNKKIIHRDMKPKNILLSSNKKNIKLCDFGLAKQLETGIKRITTICGSPLYMAPELYKKESYTESVDIWSLGLILFEMIYGTHPFAQHNDVESLSISILKNEIYIGESSEVNENCLNLLRLMLKKNEFERITMDELFENDWIKNHCILSEEELSKMFLNKNLQLDLYSDSNYDVSIFIDDKIKQNENFVNSSVDLIFEFDC